jgi:hypothetical protein
VSIITAEFYFVNFSTENFVSVKKTGVKKKEEGMRSNKNGRSRIAS